jgi:hypothetical protein
MSAEEQYAMMKALGAAAGVAALVLLFHCLPWGKMNPWRMAGGWLLGIALGTYTGCWLLAFKFAWPPREIVDRFLLILFPAVLVIESLTVIPSFPRWLGAILRFGAAVSVAPLLLYGSTYLKDLSASDSPEWSAGQAWLTLGCFAIALSVAWALLIVAQRRTPGVSLPIVMGLTCGGATLTVMLSGYATAAQLGVPLAAALGGVTLVALVNRPSRGSVSWIGPALFGLFALLIGGRFFAKLSTAHAALLFAAPLLGLLPEVPYVRRLPPWLRGGLRIVLVAAVVGWVVYGAFQVFNQDSLENYMNSAD